MIWSAKVRNDAMKRNLKVILGLSVMLFGILMIKYHKLDAEWFGTPVVVFGLLSAGIIGFALTRFKWFKKPRNGFSKKMMIALVVAIVLAPVLGVFFTEPLERGGNLTQSDVTFGRYDYQRSRMGGWYYLYIVDSDLFSSSDSGNSNVATSSSSIHLDDDAAEGLAYLFLILLVVILVVASAFIPHFWVVAMMILICITGLIALREGRVWEYNEKNPHWWRD